MRKSNNTQKALLTSAFALLMCVAMLVGTTFAWFTDTASTNVNKVQAGTLDVALEMWDGEKWVNAEGKTLNFVSENGNTEILWEPGCTYELPKLRIVNKGNLALKFKAVINGIDGDAKLNEAIDWHINFPSESFIAGIDYVLNSDGPGSSLSNVSGNDGFCAIAPDQSKEFVIKGHMQEIAGNEYQGLSIEGISITVMATQTPAEYDSNGRTYDENATYAGEAITAAELNALLTAGGEVKLDKDYVVTDAWTSIKIGNSGNPVNPSSINIDGQGHTIYGLSDALVACQPNASVTIKNLTISNAYIVGDTTAETNGLGAAAFVAHISDSLALNLDNCHVLNSTIIAKGDARAAGLVGYVSGNSMNASITNCSVENCTITGDNGAAGLVAYTQSVITVENCSVKGKTVITCTEDREGGAAKAGKLFGTISNVAITAKNTTVDATGVDVDNTNATLDTVHGDLIGRLAGAGSFNPITD